MDRKIKKKKWTVQRVSIIAAALAFVSFALYSFLFADNRSRLNVDREKITVSTVKRDVFQEFIPETGNVMPGQTFYMDAIEGGVVKDMFRESGALVEKGDTILSLSNSSLELEVMNRQAQLYEQMNIVTTTRLQLDQNDLNQKAQLAEIEYQIQLLKPQYERFKQLAEKKLVSERELEELREQYKYNQRRKELTYASYQQDSLSRSMQLRQLRLSEDRMSRSLEAVGKILDNLIIKAPISGQLSMREMEKGQSINSGERLGQVSVIDSFKVRVAIDELYQPRISKGQEGSFRYDGGEYRLVIDKIYPTVTEGNFDVDMSFLGEVPDGLRNGQSLRIRLELGKSAEAVLLPTGGFFRDTGGNWVFVLEEGSDKAVKKDIRLGRENTEHYEVLEGLKPGDRVITSSYENFGDNEVLVF